MSGKQNNRQRQRRQQAARQARARAAAQRQQHVQQKKRRTTVVFVCLGLAALTLLAVALSNSTGSGSTKVSTSTTAPDTSASSDTTEAAGPSAKGLPCVAQAAPSPAGAPTVPVKVGPPPTSLVIEDLTPGTGPAVAKGATVTVNYIGVSCSSGAVFDTSFGKQPATFPLSGVIKGWTDGIPGMKVGGRRLLGIPSDQAYGPTARSADIKADESLWFVIDVISVS